MTPTWFSVNIRLGFLMIDLSNNDCHMAEEEIDGKLINYGVMLTKRVFHYLIAKEEQRYRESNPKFLQNLSLQNDDPCGIENYVLIIIQIAGDIVENIYRLSIGNLGIEENLSDIPLWVQRLIFKPK